MHTKETSIKLCYNNEKNRSHEFSCIIFLKDFENYGATAKEKNNIMPKTIDGKIISICILVYIPIYF